MPEDYIPFDKTVEMVMKRTGRTRKQAEAFLLHHLKAGRIRSRGIPVADGEAGVEEQIPPSAWQRVATEH